MALPSCAVWMIGVRRGVAVCLTRPCGLTRLCWLRWPRAPTDPERWHGKAPFDDLPADPAKIITPRMSSERHRVLARSDFQQPGRFLSETVTMTKTDAPSMASSDPIAGLDRAQRRALIALLVYVARADRLVTDPERAQLNAALHEVGEGCLNATELSEWIANGPPATDDCQLPLSVHDWFTLRAHAIVSADARIEPIELNAIHAITRQHFPRV